MSTVADVVEFLRDFAPLELAAEWDNVGLLLGDAAQPAIRIMTCLTVTPAVAEEAVQSQAQIIVSHHPILFHGCKRLTTETPEGRMLLALIRANVAVYSPHTAFDNTRGGINDVLASRFGLEQIRPLRPGGDQNATDQCKIVVFVPDSDLYKVADAMFAAGAGHIGQYSQCSFRIPGTGTFFGSDASHPTLGQKGRREDVSEFRLETICPVAKVDAVIAALRKAHSYEEPAFDVYPLRADPGRLPGWGRIGRLPKPMLLAELAQLVRQTLSARHVDMVGDPVRSIQRIAIACGAGAEFIADAECSQADVLVTGEARFHECLAAQSGNLALLLPGHYASERPGVEVLAELLQRRFAEASVWASRAERDPLV